MSLALQSHRRNRGIDWTFFHALGRTTIGLLLCAGLVSAQQEGPRLLLSEPSGSLPQERPANIESERPARLEALPRTREFFSNSENDNFTKLPAAEPQYRRGSTVDPPPELPRESVTSEQGSFSTSVAANVEPRPSNVAAASTSSANGDNGKPSISTAILSRNPRMMLELGIEYGLPAVVALLVVIIAYLFASFAGEFVGTTMSKRLDVTLGKFFGKSTKTGILLIAVLGVLDRFGIDVTSFAAVLAAAGFAVGMALQGTLGSFAAGVMLLVFRPFRVGDYVMIGGNEGSVDEIELFTTRINTNDNRHIIVPNDDIFGQTIINYTHNALRRVDVQIGVSYSADLQQTRQVLLAVARNIDGGYHEPAPTVALKALNASSVDWLIGVWTHPSKCPHVTEQILEGAKVALDRAGISIPFPQLELHVAPPVVQQHARAA